MSRLRGVVGERTAWGVLGLVLFLIVGFVLYTYIGALMFAIFVYYATRPVYRRLDDYSEHPDVVVTATLLVITLPMLAVVGYAGLVAVQELGQLLPDQLRTMLQPYVDLTALRSPRQFLDRFARNPRAFLGPDAGGTIQQVLGPLQTYATVVVSVLTQLFLVLIFAFYLLRDDQKLSSWFRRAFDYDEEVLGFVEAVDDDLQTVFFGNLITILATGGIAIVTNYALDLLAPQGTGIGHPFLLGAVIGIATLVPIVGMKLVYVPYTLVLVGQALAGPAPLWFAGVYFAVTLVVVDTIPDFFVRSYVSAGDLNTGMVLFSYVLGTLVFGWWGLFFGPLVLVVFVHFARDVFPRLLSGTWIRA